METNRFDPEWSCNSFWCDSNASAIAVWFCIDNDAQCTLTVVYEFGVSTGGKVLLIPKTVTQKVLPGRCQTTLWGTGTFSYEQIFTGKYMQIILLVCQESYNDQEFAFHLHTDVDRRRFETGRCNIQNEVVSVDLAQIYQIYCWREYITTSLSPPGS